MENHNILVVYPHPADSATEASGTVALHAERGDKITSVVATYGERHHMQWLHDEESKPEAEQDPAVARMTLEEYRNFKKREAERIAEVLGVNELVFQSLYNDNEDLAACPALVAIRRLQSRSSVAGFRSPQYPDSFP